MSHTNATTNYSLPQFVGTDTPGWLTDVNTAMSDIDSAIYARQQAIAQNSNDISGLTSRMVSAEGSITALDADINTPSTGILDRLTTDESNISDNATNIGINSNAIAGLSTTVSGLQAAAPVTVSTTLNQADWSGAQYDIADAAVTATSIINIGLANGITDPQAEAWLGAVLLPVSITAGTGFSIRAMGNVPTVDIPVVYTREG